MSKLEEQKALPRRALFRKLTAEQKRRGWTQIPPIFDVLDPRHPLAKPKRKRAKKAKGKR